MNNYSGLLFLIFAVVSLGSCNQSGSGNGPQSLSHIDQKAGHVITAPAPSATATTQFKSTSLTLPEPKCSAAFNVLPECTNFYGKCMERHTSSFLPGATRRTLVAIEGKGFNVKEFDRLCYETCKNPEVEIDYGTFKQAVCRGN